MRQQVCWKTVARSIERPRMLLILSAFLWIWSVLQLLSTLIQRCGHRAEVLAGPISSACAQLCGTAVEVHDLGQRILYISLEVAEHRDQRAPGEFLVILVSIAKEFGCRKIGRASCRERVCQYV